MWKGYVLEENIAGSILSNIIAEVFMASMSIFCVHNTVTCSYKLGNRNFNIGIFNKCKVLKQNITAAPTEFCIDIKINFF